jgi:hypothetical protein
VLVSCVEERRNGNGEGAYGVDGLRGAVEEDFPFCHVLLVEVDLHAWGRVGLTFAEFLDCGLAGTKL